MLTAFHCLLFVSNIQLPSMLSLINTFLIQTTVTLFSMTVLPLSKNFVNQPSGGVLWKRCSENTQQRNTSVNLFRLKSVMLIMFYVNPFCHVMLFLLYHQVVVNVNFKFSSVTFSCPYS